jgi:ribosomal protein S18 acetylase RimI-like enzyme
MNQWAVREASVEDAGSIVDMVEAAAKEGKFHSDPPSKQEFCKFAFEDPPENYRLLVAFGKDGIVGYIDSRVRRGVGLILGLYVKSSFRRKGVGADMIQKTMSRFGATGCHKARLEVFLDNCEAIDFYRHLGFETEGFLRKDEERRDTIIMSKFL